MSRYNSTQQTCFLEFFLSSKSTNLIDIVSNWAFFMFRRNFNHFFPEFLQFRGQIIPSSVILKRIQQQATTNSKAEQTTYQLFPFVSFVASAQVPLFHQDP